MCVSDTPNKSHDVVWARPGDKIPTTYRGKGVVKLNVYAAIAYGSRSAVDIFECNLNAAEHVAILRRTMLPAAAAAFGGRHWCYMQDRDPKHTSKLATTWLNANVPEHFGRAWPANSPDLNPIENVWALLRDAFAACNLTTKAQLRAAIAASWAAIPQTTIDNAMDSMPNRLRAVIRAKGGSTKY